MILQESSYLTNSIVAREGWNDLITTQLLDSGYVANVCILGKSDFHLWISTPKFVPHRKVYAYNGEAINEIQCLRQVCNGQNIHCIWFAGEKYHVIRSEFHPTTIYAMGPNNTPLCVITTKQCIVLATGKDSVPGNLNSLCCLMGEYLRNHDF